MQEIAKEKKGECLSNVYFNYITKLLWKCNKGHIWSTTPSIIKNGSWCPVCAGKKQLSIEKMQEIAIKRDGECLTKTYVNCETKLTWKCNEGHTWQATPHMVKMGHWCPKCAKLQPPTIEEMYEIANKFGGECLSNDYVNGKTKLIWKCNKGHIWEAIPESIKNGSWCPICKESKGEKAIKEFLEKNKIIFEREKRFNNCKNNKKLPFDFYLPEHNILIEYDGKQHYEPVNFGGCSNEQAQKTHLQLIHNDKLKNEYCIQNNIQLIRIPHTIKNVEEFLKNNIKIINYGKVDILQLR